MKTIMKTVFGVMFLLMTASVCMASSQTGRVKSLSANARYEIVYFELDGSSGSSSLSLWVDAGI